MLKNDAVGAAVSAPRFSRRLPRFGLRRLLAFLLLISGAGAGIWQAQAQMTTTPAGAPVFEMVPSPNLFSIAWLKPEVPGDPPATEVRLRWRNSGGGWQNIGGANGQSAQGGVVWQWKLAPPGSTAATATGGFMVTGNIGGLTPTTRAKEAQVAFAQNSTDTGASLNWAPVQSIIIGTPYKPTTPAVMQSGEDGFQIDWTHGVYLSPTTANPQATFPSTNTSFYVTPTGYKVRWRPSTATTYAAENEATPAADALSHTQTGLAAAPNALYYVQVAATSAHGTGPWTAELQVRILNGAPPEDIAVERDGETVMVEWTEETGFTNQVRWRQGADTTALEAATWSAAADADTASSHAITGVSTDNLYEVQVASVAEEIRSDWSAAVRGESPPALAAVDDRTLATATDYEIFLPQASGGVSPYSYALSDLPDGLSFTSAPPPRITGMTAAAGETPMTYMAEDDEGATASQVFTITVVDFDLDVDESGDANIQDGIMIARYLLGVSGNSLTAGQSAATDAQAVGKKIETGKLGMKLDVNDDREITPADGFLIARYFLGLRGAELLPGGSADEAAAVAAKVEELLPAGG